MSGSDWEGRSEGWILEEMNRLIDSIDMDAPQPDTVVLPRWAADLIPVRVKGEILLPKPRADLRGRSFDWAWIDEDAGFPADRPACSHGWHVQNPVGQCPGCIPKLDPLLEHQRMWADRARSWGRAAMVIRRYSDATWALPPEL